MKERTITGTQALFQKSMLELLTLKGEITMNKKVILLAAASFLFASASFMANANASSKAFNESVTTAQGVTLADSPDVDPDTDPAAACRGCSSVFCAAAC
jgi:hypothetical protein